MNAATVTQIANTENQHFCLANHDDHKIQDTPSPLSKHSRIRLESDLSYKVQQIRAERKFRSDRLNGDLSRFWIEKERKFAEPERFSTTPQAVSFGKFLVFRGERKHPKAISKTGFKPIREVSETVQVDVVKNFSVFNQHQTRIIPTCGAVVYTSESAAVASAFPEFDESHYVYACLVEKGLKLHNLCYSLEDELYSAKGVCSQAEVATNQIPPENILGCWRVEKLEVTMKNALTASYIAKFSEFHNMSASEATLRPYLNHIKTTSNRYVMVEKHYPATLIYSHFVEQ